MSEAEALQTATINNAIAIGIDKDYGTVEVNKKADLILLNKNPLDDLDNLTLQMSKEPLTLPKVRILPFGRTAPSLMPAPGTLPNPIPFPMQIFLIL